jgi:hypothetical protein
MALSKPLNELTIGVSKDLFCYLPVGALMEFAKIRPVQQAGVMKLKKLIIASGYQNSSVIKVRAPPKQEHVHWDIQEKKQQLEDGTFDGSSIMIKAPEDREEGDEDYLYGVIDGAHRWMALILLVLDPEYPQYTLNYLVPCWCLNADISEELVIAIATRKFG